MIVFYALCALLGLGVYALARRLAPPRRIALALAVFLALAVLATAAIVAIGDRPPPGAKTVTPEDLLGPR